MELPAEKRDELAALLESTTLSSIISASKLVGDRLNFLSGLELMVFNHETKKVVKERKHLHKLLERETWLFGEEYNLSASDNSLDEVLRKHLSGLGLEVALDAEPVLRADGKEGIVDLMLSRTIRQAHADEHEHLSVELKRPTQPITSKILQQVKDYAFAVADDERFADTKTRWSFWAVSGDVAQDVRKEATQQNRPQGLAYDDGRVKIWVRSWSQILDSAKARLRFFQEALQYEVTESGTLDHLRQMYDAFLPVGLRAPETPRSRLRTLRGTFSHFFRLLRPSENNPRRGSRALAATFSPFEIRRSHRPLTTPSRRLRSSGASQSEAR